MSKKGSVNIVAKICETWMNLPGWLIIFLFSHFLWFWHKNILDFHKSMHLDSPLRMETSFNGAVSQLFSSFLFTMPIMHNYPLRNLRNYLWMTKSQLCVKLVIHLLSMSGNYFVYVTGQIWFQVNFDLT